LLLENQEWLILRFEHSPTCAYGHSAGSHQAQLVTNTYSRFRGTNIGESPASAIAAEEGSARDGIGEKRVILPQDWVKRIWREQAWMPQ
jgi:hypothetical protein